ncbi:MAG: hypothetical protein WBD55_08585 [Dehalococcoidia bacterium]
MKQHQHQLMNKPLWLGALVVLAGALIALAACGDNNGGKTVEKLFSPQGNELDVYDLDTDAATVLIESAKNNVNGQACLMPDGSGNFLMAEDTNQPDERQGWGIFSPDGVLVEKLLEPKTTGEAEQIEPSGCAFDSEGRLFTIDTGTGSFDATDGKLVLYFPPDYKTSCLLTTELRTPGDVEVDDAGDVLLPEAVPPGRVLRFAGPFPASADECDTVKPAQSTFIEDTDLNTPRGMVRASNGHWYISSVLLPPAIREYDADGNFVRVIAAGEDIGNPAGIAVASDGTIYYADLGLVEKPPPDFFGPEEGKGTVRKVAFDANGEPLPPVIIADGLDYPDSVSVLAVAQ